MARRDQSSRGNRKTNLPGSGGNRRKTEPHSLEKAQESVQDYSPGDWYMTPQSSRVSRARYDGRSGIMEMEWQDGGDPYLYFDVPNWMWATFHRVSSKGRYVNTMTDVYNIDYGRKMRG